CGMTFVDGQVPCAPVHEAAAREAKDAVWAQRANRLEHIQVAQAVRREALLVVCEAGHLSGIRRQVEHVVEPPADETADGGGITDVAWRVLNRIDRNGHMASEHRNLGAVRREALRQMCPDKARAASDQSAPALIAPSDDGTFAHATSCMTDSCSS